MRAGIYSLIIIGADDERLRSRFIDVAQRLQPGYQHPNVPKAMCTTYYGDIVRMRLRSFRAAGRC